MHLIGDLLPGADETPRFSQLYIYDTDNEVFNRMRNARYVKDHPSLSSRDSLRLKLIKKHTTDARIYNLPAADEIAALIVAQDRPDLLSRVFKIKLNALMKDITKEFLFGTCRAGIM
ncbi:ATP-dependent DNA helicase PIF1 [Senna tora]|uniref:ATP-dependent DNA helicase PIF1 n=1 Tax=Senna tora TaxID=362788 RepID=A0A834WLG7_9FABA|nr:ATP-dependent DNA helicase PIF1 [Senna tora]